MLHGFTFGSEILDLSIKLRRDLKPDPQIDFDRELNLFLLSRKVCDTLEQAADTSFLLQMSSKGSLLNSTTF